MENSADDDARGGLLTQEDEKETRMEIERGDESGTHSDRKDRDTMALDSGSVEKEKEMDGDGDDDGKNGEGFEDEEIYIMPDSDDGIEGFEEPFDGLPDHMLGCQSDLYTDLGSPIPCFFRNEPSDAGGSLWKGKGGESSSKEREGTDGKGGNNTPPRRGDGTKERKRRLDGWRKRDDENDGDGNRDDDGDAKRCAMKVRGRARAGGMMIGTRTRITGRRMKRKGLTRDLWMKRKTRTRIEDGEDKKTKDEP